MGERDEAESELRERLRDMQHVAGLPDYRALVDVLETERRERERRQQIDDRYNALPKALQKAVGDYYTYALGLHDGTVIFFHQAAFNATLEWVELTPLHPVEYDQIPEPWRALHMSDYIDGLQAVSRVCAPFPRGIEVRVSEIAWVADSPWEA